MPKYVYHLTHKNNIPSIMCDDALRSSTNTIYVCPTKRDIAYFAPLIVKSNLSDYVLFKINTRGTTPKLWSVSTDHNRKFINADSFVYHSPELRLGDDVTVEIFPPMENLFFPYL